MPELPSVEVFKQYFDSNSLNQIIKSVNLKSKEILMEKPIKFQEILVGSQFTSSQRYGKYLFANLDNDYILVMHFGMTGYLEYGLNPLKNPYDRFSINFQNNQVLAFIDPRKFGKIGITDSTKNFIKKKKLGPDALNISYKEFKTNIKKRKGTLKPLLLNQNFIAGIGNLYADEILYQSSIHPLTHADELNAVKIRKLYHSMKKVLIKAIEYMDKPEILPESYLLPNRHVNGDCPCGGKISIIKVGGRTTYFCPECQTIN